MPVFILTPRNLKSEKWSQSRHKGTCMIFTDDEQTARGLASNAFTPILGMPRYHPWVDESLVSVDITTKHSPGYLRKNKVYIFGLNGEFILFNKDAPDGGAGAIIFSGTGALEATSAQVAGHAEVSNSTDVHRVIQNRQVIALHTTGLLALLDDFCKPASLGSNMQRPQLWLDDDISTDQLRALLTDLRGELRQLKELLAQVSPDNAILQALLSAVEATGKGYLQQAMKVAATGTGLVLISGLGGLLVAAGLIEIATVHTIIATTGAILGVKTGAKTLTKKKKIKKS